MRTLSIAQIDLTLAAGSNRQKSKVINPNDLSNFYGFIPQNGQNVAPGYIALKLGYIGLGRGSELPPIL